MSKNSAVSDCSVPHIYEENDKKRSNLTEYFENLQHKLLEESQNLTNFLGKSFLNLSSKPKIRPSCSVSRDKSENHRKIELEKLKEQKLSVQNQINSYKTLKPMERETKHKTPVSLKPLKEVEPIVSCKDFVDTKFGFNYARICSENQLNRDYIKQQESVQRKVFDRALLRKRSMKDTVSTDNSKSEYMSYQSQRKTNSLKSSLQIQDFKLIKFLQEGKFGEVFLVQHRQTGFVCALKKMRKQVYQSDKKIVNQIIRQIKIQSFLDHPNIVQLYSIFKDDEFLYLLLQLCSSGNLLQYLIKKGRLSQQKVRSIIKQICYAVEYMHDNDIIHRDIKPQNILFHENIIKVCDFGWSVASPLLRQTLCGTPIYSSPEIVKGKQYDSKVDIWNIGILTYELLYGKVPFEIRSQEDLSKVIEQEIYFPKSIPASLQIKDFINQCLIKDPKKRISITKLIDHQFLLLT